LKWLSQNFGLMALGKKGMGGGGSSSSYFFCLQNEELEVFFIQTPLEKYKSPHFFKWKLETFTEGFSNLPESDSAI